MGRYQKFITTLSGNKIRICLNSIWDFPNIISDYGDSSYSGRIPAEAYLNFFYYFTNPKDAILDLFCGSGTGIDIGKDYDRKVIGFDLNPYRKDIIKFDVLTDKNPFLDRVLDHIFLDPPYFNMNKGKYTKEKTDLSNLSYHDFLNALELIIRKFYNSLKVNGYLGLIISNKRDKGNLTNIEQDVNLIYSKYLVLKHKIIVPYHNTHDQSNKRAKHWSERKFLLIGHRTLFIYQKSESQKICKRNF